MFQIVFYFCQVPIDISLDDFYGYYIQDDIQYTQIHIQLASQFKTVVSLFA